MNDYDGSRRYEMDEFLTILYNMSLSTNEPINDREVYHLLCCNNLLPYEREIHNGCISMKGKSNEEMFSVWKEHFIDSMNTRAFRDEIRWPYFFQFLSKDKLETKEFIKLYIPLNYDHLQNGAIALFDFLDRMGIRHVSKISKQMRVDNVIVRLHKNDIESAQRIIDFISNNINFRKGLNRVNPFIPTINGIGFMVEHGNSYNSDISKYLADFINKCKANGISYVDSHLFFEYLQNCKQRNYALNRSGKFDTGLLDTFEEAYTGKKKRNLNQNEKYTTDQKKALFIDALKATYLKYGFNQVAYALYKIVHNGNFEGITNGNSEVRYRDELMHNISQDEIIGFINEALVLIGVTDTKQMDFMDKAEKFCMILFSDSLPFELDEICGATLDKYGQSQLESALYHYVNFGISDRFTRFSTGQNGVNYRDKLHRINKNLITEIIAKSLSLRGIDTRSINPGVIIGIYAETLSRAKYSSFDETPQLSSI